MNSVTTRSSAKHSFALPNLLTYSRIIAVPVVVGCMYAQSILGAPLWLRWVALFVFIAAGVTDFLDGYYARTLNQQSAFGRMLDPIADKLLIGTALIALSLENTVSWWFTAIILVREIAITLLRFKVINRGVIPASRGGKAKTISQIVAILAYLVPLDGWVNEVALVAMWSAVVLTLATGIDYVFRAYRLPDPNSNGSGSK